MTAGSPDFGADNTAVDPEYPGGTDSHPGGGEGAGEDEGGPSAPA